MKKSGNKKANSVGNQKVYETKFSAAVQGKKLGAGKSTNKTI